MIVHKEFTVYDPAGQVYYEPFVSEDGRVGYRVGTTDGTDRETFLYLNPSQSEGPNDANVFVYEGGENDPNDDEPLCFVVPETLVCR